MKKHILIIIVLLLALTFSSCGSKTARDADFESLSRELLASEAFTDILNPVSADIAAELYGIDPGDIAEVRLFCSTGATAEEIALFRASGSDAAGRILTAVNARIQAQIGSYSDYVPEELPKLENAIIEQLENIIILVVPAEEKDAKAIINKYI